MCRSCRMTICARSFECLFFAVKKVENGEMSPERIDANWQTGRYKEPAFTQKIEQLVPAYIMVVFRELDLKFTRA